MICFEQVKKVTTEEYFNGNQFSIDAFNKKYSQKIQGKNETYPQALKRVCDYIASAEETEELRQYWSDRWFDEIYDDWWHPAGSIMQGANSGRHISLANCFSRDTRFITDKGIKSFEQFNPGDEVNVLTNMGGFKKAVVKSFGHQNLVEVVFCNNGIRKSIKCTPKHIWRIIQQTTITHKTTDELIIGDQVPFTGKKYNTNKNGRYFCPLGFIHGLVFGDGTYEKISDTCRLSLCGDSRQFIKYFSGFDWVIDETNKDQIRISYLPNYMKKFPDFDKINSEYLLGFLIGWFAADGSVGKNNGSVSLCHNNKENLKIISDRVASLGIYSTGYIKVCRDADNVTINNKKYSNRQYQLYSISFMKECLFESFFVKDTHKQKWISNLSSTRPKKQHWKVESIKDLKTEEEVWCIEEPKTHTFTLEFGISTNNCTTVSLGGQEDTNWDNLESIIKNTVYSVAKMAAYRQGLGLDFSKIRPRGLGVKNSSNESQGVVHWMKLIDSIGNYIGQKGRIPAMLFSISIDHPDVEEFIKVKGNHTVIQNANISVQTNNAFYEAVEKDSDWELYFKIPGVKSGDRIYVDVHSTDMECLKDEFGKFYRIAKKDREEEVITKKVKARYLLELIAKNMTANAEPGIQQIDMARYWSNSDYVYDPNDIYCSKIISSNACSEQYLSRDSLCVLASINVGRFDIDKAKYTNELKKIAYSINRFLDNVNTMEIVGNTYATPHQKLAIEKLRRTGAGVTNVAGWLFKQNFEYGSEDGNNAMFDFNRIYNFYLYESSISLGKEKGSFGLFVREKFEQSPFVQNMMAQGLVFEAMRNCTCSSIAPAGTLSTMFRDFVMSYGVEPGFGIYYWKRTRISGKYEYYFCVPSVVRTFFKDKGYEIPIEADCVRDSWDGSVGVPIAKFIDDTAKKIGIKFKRSTEINAMDKLDLMSKLMKYVDSSISVTYSLPEGASWKDTANLIVEANKKGVKSIAVFQDKKMYGIVSYIPFKKLAIDLKAAGSEIYSANFSEEEAKELNLVTETRKLAENAPKRKTELESDVYQVSVKGKKYIMAVGIQDGAPYEMFGGQVPDSLSFKFTNKKGKMSKVKQHHYKLEIGDVIEINNFGEHFTASEQMLFRMISISLRYRIPIKFIVDQLNKAAEDVSDLSAAASRVLKKYIKDGEAASGVCPDCGKSELIYSDGCVSCACGWDKGCG